MVKIEEIKQLRSETGVSISDCKKALEEANGNVEKAKEVLRKLGNKIVKKRASRDAACGVVHSYIHPNSKIGVLLEIYCETDFVARSEPFQTFLKEVSLHIAATNPLLVSEEEITPEFLSKEREIYTAQMANQKKPAEIIEKIVEGKIEKYKKEVVLLSQKWVKDSSKTIKGLLDEIIAKTGENIKIKRFTRYEAN